MSLNRKLRRTALLGGAAIGGAGLAIGAGTVAGLAVAFWGLRAIKRFELAGKVVVITGGSRGLGLALAREFLRKRAKVALLARNPEELERARQLLAASGEVFVRPCDVRDQNQVGEAMTNVRQHFGDVDVLVNNAGTLTVGPMDNMSVEDYRESLEIYFWAPFHTTLAVLPEMRRKRSGRIVNISSIGGKISVPHLLPYSVGKFALAGFSEGLRSELARDNVYVTSVFPGLMRTGSARNADFKGKHRAEYTWFLLSDSVPGFTISADRAARQIVRACQYGTAKLIITFAAKFAVAMHALFPGLASAALALANRGLPGPKAGDTKKKGAESTTPLTDSWLTALDRRAAKRNNQVPHVSVVKP